MKVKKKHDIALRPVMECRVKFGHYLRAERIRIGLTSAEAFVDYLQEVTGLFEGVLTPRMVYNLEDAKSSIKAEAMPLSAIANFAEQLFESQPSIRYLFNPSTKKPFTSDELLYILYGWIDIDTGEYLVPLRKKNK